MFLDSDGYPRPIRAAVIAAAGTDGPVVCVPDLDLQGVGVIWSVMTDGIAVLAGHWIGPACIAEITSTAVGAASDYVDGSRILTWLAVPLAIAFPVSGVPAAVAVKSMLSAIFTLRLAEECVRHFAAPVFTPSHLSELTGHISDKITQLPHGEEITRAKNLLTADWAMGR
jgi:hypothetical protein